MEKAVTRNASITGCGRTGLVLRKPLNGGSPDGKRYRPEVFLRDPSLRANECVSWKFNFFTASGWLRLPLVACSQVLSVREKTGLRKHALKSFGRTAQFFRFQENEVVGIENVETFNVQTF